MRDSREDLSELEDEKLPDVHKKINNGETQNDTVISNVPFVDEISIIKKPVKAIDFRKEKDKISEESQNSNHQVEKNYSTNLTSQKNAYNSEPDFCRQVSVQDFVESDLMHKFPPDFELARIHADARRVKNLDQCEYEKDKLNDSKYFCPCCQMPTTVSAPLYPYCSENMELEDFGCGFPLYFYFKIFLMVAYGVMIICTSITGWIIYANGEDGDQWQDDEKEPTPFSTIISIGNLGISSSEYNSSKIYAICALNTVAMILIYLLNFAYKPIQVRVIKKVDEINISPADFAVMVSNIPKDKTKKQIMEWLITQEEGKICDINLCYDIKEPIVKLKKLEKLKKLFANYGKIKNTKSKVQLQSEIKTIETEIEVVKEKLRSEETDQSFTGKAFVIYNQQSDIVNITTKFHQSWLKKFYSFIMIYLCKKKDKVQDSCWWDGQRVKIERAAEPTNIYFENMDVTEKTRFYRSLVTYFFAFLCLCLVFLVNLLLSFLRKTLGEDSNKDKSTAEIIIRSIASISFVSSIVIANNNSLLAQVVRYISKFERHETYTKFNLTIALKLTACMFINTAFIPFIVKLDKKDWFGPSGLANDAFLIVMIMNFITPTINLIGFGNIIRKLRLKFEKWRGEKSTMIQKDANELSEGVEFDTPFLYATTMVTFYITCFYASLIPMLPIISLLGIVYKYFVDRYLLLRRCKLPQEMAEQMAMTFSDLVPLGIFFYALGQFYFITVLSNGENKFPHLALWLSVVGVIVPCRQMFHKCSGEVKRDDEETYDKNKSKFINDYDRLNPVTEKEAKLRHLQEIGDVGDNEDVLRKKYKKKKKAGKILPTLQNFKENIKSNGDDRIEKPPHDWTLRRDEEISKVATWDIKKQEEPSHDSKRSPSPKELPSVAPSNAFDKRSNENDMIVKEELIDEELKEEQQNQIIEEENKEIIAKQTELKYNKNQVKLINGQCQSIFETKEGLRKNSDQPTIEETKNEDEALRIQKSGEVEDDEAQPVESDNKPQRKYAWKVGEVKIDSQPSQLAPQS